MASNPPPPHSILVYVGVDLLGDGLIRLPFVRALRNAFPEAHITWLAGTGPSAYAGVLAPLVTGLLDCVIENAGIGGRLKQLLVDPRTGTALAGCSFDLVIDTQRRFTNSLIVRKIPHRLFISGSAAGLLSDRRPAAKPSAMIDQLLVLVACAAGKPVDTHAPLVLSDRLTATARRLLPEGPTYVGLAPGAGGRIKCWPLENYIALARNLSERGRQAVILLGPGEEEWHDQMAAALPDALFPLQDSAATSGDDGGLITIALAARLAAAVANDAGIGHMLAAADCPLVSLFGPTPPAKFAPLVSHGRVIRAQDFGTGDAMTAIPVEAVAAAVAELLAELTPNNLTSSA